MGITNYDVSGAPHGWPHQTNRDLRRKWSMYIDPFWAGVAATLLAEVAAITALVIIKVKKEIGGKE